MKMFIILSTLICLVAGGRRFHCSFDDEELRTRSRTGNGRNWHDVYRWEGGKVPYFFTDKVIPEDKIFVREQMKTIENKTCVRFTEYSESTAPEHHLKINIEQQSCRHGRFSAGVRPEWNSVLFHSKYQFADRWWCRGWKFLSGGVIHELFHALGVMHTHKRMDRDEHVLYNKDCLKYPENDAQFTKQDFRWKKESEGIKYELNSVMHYECDTMGKRNCNPLTPVDGTSCNDVGGDEATEMDWKMVNQYQCQPTCSYQDHDWLCPIWIRYCSTNEYVKENCQASCKC